MAKLTVRKCRSLSKPGLHSDGGTLFLRVAPGGSKQWIQRLTINGKRHDLGLGPFPVVDLERARHKAMANRVAVYEGRDPLAEKRRAAMPTFAAANDAVFAAKSPTWRGNSSAKQWRQSMGKHVLPVLAATPLDRITQEDVLSILTPIWTATPAAARRTRQRLVSVFEWGMAHRHIRMNPAGEAINGALPRTAAVRDHNRALPYQEVGAALDVIEGFSGGLAARLAFRLTILTATRNGEARGARWDEIDLQAATWTIPASRMKASREHRIPLSAAAVETIERARELDNGSGLVFPSPVKRGKELSNGTFANMLKRLGLAEKTTPHGFRSAFRNWAAETSKPREVAEQALAHTVAGVEGSYFTSDLFERRRRLMEQWAAYLLEESAKIVPIRA